MRQRKRGSSRFRFQRKFDKNTNSLWKQVEIDGKVLSHDNASFDGFAGLEVLEDYDKRFVKKAKFQRDEINLRTVDRLPKVIKEKDSGVESEEDILELFAEEEQDFDPVQIKKTKSKRATVPDESDDEDESKKQPTKKQKVSKTNTSNTNENDTPGKFVLLKKNEIDSDEDEDKEAVKDVNVVSPNVDFNDWRSLGVPEEILKALVDKKFTYPTEIQRLTIPPAILGRKDILGAAETGSGKTLAFGIPIIDGILKSKKQDDEPANKLYALILTPTRELASQVHSHLKDIAQYTGIKIAVIIGGLATVKQKRVLKQCPEIVIGTPGRLWELIEGGDDHLAKIEQIKYFAVDETDRMVEKGHFDEMQKILEIINSDEQNQKSRQNFIFSATLLMVHDLPDYVIKRAKRSDKPLKSTPGQKVQQLIEAFGLSNPKIVDITSSTGTAKLLTESRILCQMDQKDVYLYYFLQKHPGRTIVFCNSIECVKRLVSLLSYLNCSPFGLHGNMIQKQRLKNIDRFKANSLGLLIATDVAARGLDIPLVQHVLHYQTPKTTENYVHRSGRTARANNEGLAVLLMEPSEVKFYTKLYQDLGRSEDLPIFPTLDKYLKIARERVILAREVEKIDLLTRREATEENWSRKIAKEADLAEDSSDQDSDASDDKRRDRTEKKSIFKQKSLQLAQLLSKPMFADATKYPSMYTSNLTDTKKKPAENSSAIDAVKQSMSETKEWKKNRNKKRKQY